MKQVNQVVLFKLTNLLSYETGQPGGAVQAHKLAIL
jgi:hypothetical protein